MVDEFMVWAYLALSHVICTGSRKDYSHPMDAPLWYCVSQWLGTLEREVIFHIII